MPLPAFVAPTAKAVGPVILSHFLGKRDQDKAQRKQDRRAAFANLQNTLSPGQGAIGSPQQVRPGLASQLAVDPLVQKQVMDMMGKLLGRGGSKAVGGSRNLLQQLLGGAANQGLRRGAAGAAGGAAGGIIPNIPMPPLQ